MNTQNRFNHCLIGQPLGRCILPATLTMGPWTLVSNHPPLATTARHHQVNYSFKIIGTDNVQNATIAAANKVCNQYLVHALKGDTLLCSLGGGHNCAHVSITRNVHVANFIATLNKVKDKNWPLHHCNSPKLRLVGVCWWKHHL